MIHKGLLESLLRPPVEFITGCSAMLMAIIAGFLPSTFMLTPGAVSYLVCAYFSYESFRYLRYAYRLKRYQRGLKILPKFTMSSDEIPVRDKLQYIGRGFEWDQRHTQRLHETRNPLNAKYVVQSKAWNLARDFENTFIETPVFHHVSKFLGSQSFLNPFKPAPPVGGFASYHAVGLWEGERDIYNSIAERVAHTVVLGTTRVGKTRLAELLIEQDIRRGDITIVFDPKGDADLLRRVYGTATEVGRKCYIFHLGYPEISASYNPVGDYERVTEVATRTTGPLPNEGNSAAFKEFAWRFVNIIARALNTLGDRPDYPTLTRYINNIEPLLKRYAVQVLDSKEEFEGWEGIVLQNAEKVDDRNLPFSQKGRDPYMIALVNFFNENIERIDDAVLEGLVGAWSYDKTYFDKIISSLGPLMEKLTTGETAKLLAPNYEDLSDPRPILNFNDVIRENAVVYIGLDALSDSVVAAAVGNAMFADITSISGKMYKHGRYRGLAKNYKGKEPKISIHADEFNELIGDEFIPLLNKAGGSGIQVTAYTQVWSDVEARLGDAAKARQVAGNLNTMIMLRVREEATAEMLTKSLPEVEVNNLTAVSSSRDSSDPDSGTEFTSTNEDRTTTRNVPMLEAADLMKLPKGQAYAMIEGGKIYKLRLPLPGNDPHLPKDLEAVAKRMEQSYSSVSNDWKRDWWLPMAQDILTEKYGSDKTQNVNQEVQFSL